MKTESIAFHFYHPSLGLPLLHPHMAPTQLRAPITGQDPSQSSPKVSGETSAPAEPLSYSLSASQCTECFLFDSPSISPEGRDMRFLRGYNLGNCTCRTHMQKELNTLADIYQGTSRPHVVSRKLMSSSILSFP